MELFTFEADCLIRYFGQIGNFPFITYDGALEAIKKIKLKFK